jgi:hypothetical protein
MLYLILLVLTVVCYLRCRRTGRKPWLWIPMVWVFAIGAGVLAGFLSIGVLAKSSYPLELVRPTVYYLAMTGLIAGGLVAVFCAGQPLRSSGNCVTRPRLKRTDGV